MHSGRAAPLSKIIAACDRIVGMVDSSGLSRTETRHIQTGDSLPVHDPSDVGYLLDGISRFAEGAEIRQGILKLVRDEVQRAEVLVQAVYRNTTRRVVSLEHLGWMTDAEYENTLLKWFQEILRERIASIEQSVLDTVRACAGISLENRSSTGFSAHTTMVLEQAYSHAQILSQAECSIVAQRAGISHQQVRTWFQNKRNRKRGVERRTASASAVQTHVSESAIPGPRRVISALPKRAAGKTAERLQPPTERPVRALPRPGHQAPVPNYKEDASDESSCQESSSQSVSLTRSSPAISDVSSVPENGGFINPLSLYLPINASQAGTQVVIAQTGNDDHVPKLDFTPPTPLNQRMCGQYTDSPSEVRTDPFGSIEYGMSESDVEFLLRDLQMPTLSGSPSFSASEASIIGDMQGSPGPGGWQNHMEQEIMRVMGMLLDPTAPVVETPAQTPSQRALVGSANEGDDGEMTSMEQGLDVALSTGSSISSPTSSLITPWPENSVSQSKDAQKQPATFNPLSEENSSMEMDQPDLPSWAPTALIDMNFDPSLFPYSDCPIPYDTFEEAIQYGEKQHQFPAPELGWSKPEYASSPDVLPVYTQPTYMDYSSSTLLELPIPIEYLPTAIPYPSSHECQSSYDYQSPATSSMPSPDEQMSWIGGVLPFDQRWDEYGMDTSEGVTMGYQGTYIPA